MSQYLLTLLLPCPPAGVLWDFPSSTAYLSLHATACGLRRTSTSSPFRMLLFCLRCTLKPSASAICLFRSCTSASGSAISPTTYRILCLRLAHLVHRVSRQCSAMDPRLDTGGWLTLLDTPFGGISRQGLAPCKIRRAFLGAITSKHLYVSRRESSGCYGACRVTHKCRWTKPAPQW